MNRAKKKEKQSFYQIFSDPIRPTLQYPRPKTLMHGTEYWKKGTIE